MQRSGSGFASSPPTKPLADPKLAAGDKFWSWNSLAKKAKAVLLDDGICSRVPEAEKATPEPRSQVYCLMTFGSSSSTMFLPFAFFLMS